LHDFLTPASINNGAILSLFTFPKPSAISTKHILLVYQYLPWPACRTFATAAKNEFCRSTVVDVWESEETLESFAKNDLMPAFQKLNLNPPMPQVFSVYNTMGVGEAISA